MARSQIAGLLSINHAAQGTISASAAAVAVAVVPPYCRLDVSSQHLTIVEPAANECASLKIDAIQCPRQVPRLRPARLL